MALVQYDGRLAAELELAEEEAARFLQRCKELREHLVSDASRSRYGDESTYRVYGVQAAAVRRASLDLTRALAKMRRR